MVQRRNGATGSRVGRWCAGVRLMRGWWREGRPAARRGRRAWHWGRGVWPCGSGDGAGPGWFVPIWVRSVERGRADCDGSGSVRMAGMGARGGNRRQMGFGRGAMRLGGVRVARVCMLAGGRRGGEAAGLPQQDEAFQAGE